jgi:transposase
VDTLTMTYWQRRHLERQLHSTRDARVYRRTLAVLEVANGESIASVARRLRVTPRAVYHWVASYGRDHAPDALADRDRSGRPRLLTPADQELLRELLSCSPQGRGYFAAQWTVPLLREHLARRTGRPLSDDTLRRELQRLRYTWKRSRYTLDPDPEFGGTKEAHPASDPAIAGP